MRSKEDTKGMGKRKRRQGKSKGGQPTHQTPRTQPGRAEKERGEGKASRNTTTPLEGEGTVGDEPGYTPTPEDLRLQEVYGDWVHANPGTHLDGGIRDNSAWQAWWRDLAVNHQGAMTRRVGELGGGLSGCWGRSSGGYGTDCGTWRVSSSFRR